MALIDAGGGCPAVVVHTLDQALAAAGSAREAGTELVVLSAVGGGGSVGVGWFAALSAAVIERYGSTGLVFVLDCADEAGTALGALRRGITHIRFSGPPLVAAKLAAAGLVLYRASAPTLDLLDSADPLASCRKFLAGRGDAGVLPVDDFQSIGVCP